MPITELMDPNLDNAVVAAIQLIEQLQLEPVQLVSLTERLNQAQRFAQTAQLYQLWLQRCQSPSNYVIQFNLGAVLSSMGQLSEAELSYRAAIEQKSDFIQAWFNLAALLEQQQRLAEALALWQQILVEQRLALDAAPEIRQFILQSLQRRLADPNLDLAVMAARILIEQQLLEPMQLVGLAERLTAQQVVPLYYWWLQHSQSPINYIIQFNLGVSLTALERITEAEASYRAAIAQKPDFIQAWFNLGTVLERLKRPQEALKVWQSMLDEQLVSADTSKDMYLLVLNNLGRLLEETRLFRPAEAKLLASLNLEPWQPNVIQHWVHLRQKQCVWPTYQALERLSVGDMLKATSPLAMLSTSDDPGLQLATAMRFVKERVNQRVPDLTSGQGYAHQRLRLGFLSSDFCLHAVSLLTVELLELLDRDLFEIYGFCWTREDGSELRERVKRAMDHFIPLGGLDDASAAQSIRQHEIDILIDLHGLTSGARANILMYRPAPVQMTYLGFPGSSGLPCIDYVIADRYLIPDAEKAYYSEMPLYLPKVFQCSDRKRPVGALPTRAQHGLPESAFVFCSFNNNYKFTDSVFDCWMSILSRVPNSLLWLLADNPWAQNNMIARAKEQGIEPERLVFGRRLAPADYLARYSLADLFLDAYPFNAGTTANDALWMGLPVLTRSGRTFASRMAGSLLTALKLPELITQSLSEYEERAVQLASHPEQVTQLKQRLLAGHESSPLFDMPGFVRDFGQALMSVAIRA